MSHTPCLVASAGADAFRPRIIALDASGDQLSCFSSEAERTLVRRASEPTAEVSPAPHLVVRVPKGLGPGVVATLTGAFCGLVFAAVVSPLERPALGVGKLTVTSEPSGAVVAIDGSPRGVTPLTAVIDVGAHHVAVGNGPAARPRLLRVTPGGEAFVHVERRVDPVPVTSAVAAVAAPADVTAPAGVSSVAAAPPNVRVARSSAPSASVPGRPAAPAPPRRPATGWITVTSPFPVRVLREGVDIGGSDGGKVRLPAGTGTVVFVNEALEFRDEREVTVTANRSQTIAIDAPDGVLHANARPWAEVWVDGRRAGDTPLGNLSLPIGEHEVLFRHPRLGEARQRVTVGARTPARVSVELQP